MTNAQPIQEPHTDSVNQVEGVPITSAPLEDPHIKKQGMLAAVKRNLMLVAGPIADFFESIKYAITRPHVGDSSQIKHHATLEEIQAERIKNAT